MDLVSKRKVLQPTRYACAAACVAMITGVDIQRVFDFIGHDCAARPMRFVEIGTFLLNHGYHLGGFSSGAHRGSMIRFDWSVRQPAYLVVKSRRTAGNHAVFWDGWQVLDPEPANEGSRLQDYTVSEWWPVLQLCTEAVQK